MHIISLLRPFIVVSALTVHPTIGIAEDAKSYMLIDNSTVAPLDMFRECDHCPEMVVVPLGSFMMGATPEESRDPFDIYGEGASGRVREPDEINIIPDEHPRHQVDMDIPYAIGRNEVTHAEWMACVDDGACRHNPTHESFKRGVGYIQLGPDHPAINVSYLDILEYVAWLNGVVGAEVYRLPTEAEWEYAARSGTQTRFAQGDELTAQQANFSRGATEHIRRGQEMPDLVSRYIPVPVYELDAANAWGIRHMSGNVGEYTLSCWAAQHLGLATDSAYLATTIATTDCEWRVVKGGAHNIAMEGLRPARRYRGTEDRRRDSLGFRLIRYFNEEK